MISSVLHQVCDSPIGTSAVSRHVGLCTGTANLPGMRVGFDTGLGPGHVSDIQDVAAIAAEPRMASHIADGDDGRAAGCTRHSGGRRA